MSEFSGKTYQTELDVRAYELDSFGHVNHANYLHYLETARWKMLGEEGITLDTIREWDRWPVIAEIQIQYRRPLYLGDRVSIETRVVALRRSSMQIEQNIFARGALAASAKIRSVTTNGKGEPAEIHPEARKKFQASVGTSST